MIRRYLEMYPHMKSEEIPEELTDFCEYIIQQNADMADAYFKKNQDVAKEFLKHFRFANGREFYRGGYPNIDRKFLSVSNNKEVAINFAKHRSNSHIKDNSGNGYLHTISADKYYKTKCEVDNEEEVFLWRPRIIVTENIKDKSGDNRTNLFK